MAIWDLKEINKKERANEWINRGDRCAFGGGYQSSDLNTIDYISAAAGGTAVDFGDLTAARGTMQDNYGTHVRGIFAGGKNLNTIDYITMATTGDATDFGDLLQTRRYVAGGGNTVRGVYGGGISSNPSSGHYNIIEFLTPTSTGNTADFGDLTQTKERLGALSSPTRLVWAAGAVPGDTVQDVIEYVQIASTGNGVDFGDVPTAIYGPMCASNAVRGLIAGGSDGAPAHNEQNVISYITIATTGDAADFGDLTGDYLANGSASGGTGATRGIIGNDDTGLDMVTISTTGNATDFGDTSVERSGYGGMSTGHGGLDVDNVQRPSATYMPGSGRGLIIGGESHPGGSNLTEVEVVHIPTLGNATDFGDLYSVAKKNGTGSGSITRGITAGGRVPGSDNGINSIESYEFASLGKSADFGDLNNAVRDPGSTSSTTRSIFGGGTTPSNQNVIDYSTIATAGDATDFGDLTVARRTAAAGSNTRGVFLGGYTPSVEDEIDYVTIASTGNATDFGDLVVAAWVVGSASSSVRTVAAGMSTDTSLDSIDYITTASTGDAADFGNLTQARSDVSNGQITNSTRAVFAAGWKSPGSYNIIDYITIASTGNATDFGDTNQNKFNTLGLSDNHGGLQDN